MPAKSIVLIEDETVVRHMLRIAVEQAATGMKVTSEFGDGKEGLEYCLVKPPTLLICDLSLPGMHGFDVIKSLREKQPQVRILVLTSRADATLPAQIAALGVQGYVDKTKPLPMLLEAIREVASGGIYFAAKGVAPEPLHQPQHGPTPNLPVIPGADPLSPREIEVAKMVAEGNASKEIADKLGLSVRTVEKHRANIMDKTGVRDVASLTRYCIHHGLVRP
ncbi:MAG: response regulator transcription factor [Opitutaceae bacterium]|jgi:DNA-binding NarL/FixJ family response regulator